MDPALAGAVQELIDQHIGAAPVRYGQAPKRLMPFKLKGDRFGKVKVAWQPIPGTGDEGRDPRKPPAVEILANGQQFVALGIHPRTGEPYRWERDPDLRIPRDLLPTLDEATARHFMAVLAGFITDLGGKVIKPAGAKDERNLCQPAVQRAPA